MVKGIDNAFDLMEFCSVLQAGWYFQGIFFFFFFAKNIPG